ncbi:MAG TPA: RNA polymerase subunit sigma-24 [Ruminococcus sp.]|nr:RNA polymerase sigma factor [Ruminococcus sp.]HBB19278.1 RNA polymerase subunit sigma-24 [Ruminococcus sp.]HOR21574.1 RNA polymerase sigma factor [Ruminococcus sp.]
MAIDLREEYDKIFRYCYIRVRDRHTAEDLTQETFLRYLERPHYHSGTKTLRLLYTIARNLCVDEYRRRSSQDLPEDLPSGADIEEGVLESLSLQQALAELPYEDRELLLLRYVNDVPVSVISGLLGVSRSTVNRRLKRITEDLRIQLGKEELE